MSYFYRLAPVCMTGESRQQLYSMKHDPHKAKANSAFYPFAVGKWIPASAGKAKAGMVHSVSGWTRGVQVKLWNPLRTRVIPERLRDVFMTRRYTNPRLPLPYHTVDRLRWRQLITSSMQIRAYLSVAWWVVAVSSVGRRFAAVLRFRFPGLHTHVPEESAFFLRIVRNYMTASKPARSTASVNQKTFWRTLHSVLHCNREHSTNETVSSSLLLPEAHCKSILLLLGLLLCYMRRLAECRAKISWNACKRVKL